MLTGLKSEMQGMARCCPGMETHRPNRNRDQRCSVGTRRLLQTGCGWQSPGEAADNYPDLKLLASNADCIAHALPRGTSGTPDDLLPFAMMVLSSQLAFKQSVSRYPRPWNCVFAGPRFLRLKFDALVEQFSRLGIRTPRSSSNA